MNDNCTCYPVDYSLHTTHYEPNPGCSIHGNPDYKALELAIGEVLFNVNNYQERARSRMLGSDFSKLKNKLIAAVLAAGFRKVE